MRSFLIALLSVVIGTVISAYIIQEGRFAEDRQGTPATDVPPATAVEIPLTPPVLLYPADGSTITQPYRQSWVFRWQEPSYPKAVKQYHLYVIKESAAYPAVDIFTEETNCIIPQSCSYISDDNLLNWRWRVRVQSTNDTWSPWSDEYTFSVYPVDWVLFYERCPEIAP